MIAKSQRWQKTAVAIAAVTLLGFPVPDALALSLGRVTVLSALGEPLRAEIDIPNINAEEASSLKATVATPEAFIAAGLDYNPAMSSLRATLQQRPDGRSYIRLSSDRAINDPFVDMILEASWSSGRIVRDYTMLFDPPAFRKPSAAQAPTLPQITIPLEPATTPVAPARPAAAAAPAPRPAPLAAAKPVPPPSAAAASKPVANKNVVVKPGDTAGRIAATFKPQGVSLDQMLVALLRANPEVFVNDNINRIRTGAVMNLPTAQEAQVVPPAEATQIILAQSKDFNTFRRNLASNVTAAPVGSADRKASGAIEAKVDDKKGSAVTPDKLTLSKGSVQSKAEESKIVNDLAAKDAALRAKDIEKNIKALNQIGTATSAVTAPAAPASSAVPAIPVAVTAPEHVASAPAPAVVASSPAVVVSAPAPVAAPEPAASAPAMPASAPLEPPVAALPEPEPSAGLIETLTENPAIPGALAGLLALLGGFAAFKFWKRKKKSKSEGEVLESRLQPDSFFGSSGGQRVDTNDADGFKPSSILFSASQLESGDDVDPVAEADVYLAYGRDAQAEEILKEALRTNPTRLAIRTKLLEILAKRRDVKGFESAASQALVLTTKNSTDWNRICEMGLGIDPHTPMYQPDGATKATAPGTPSAAAAAAAADFGGQTMPVAVSEELSSTSDSVDLDLDFAFDEDAQELAPVASELPASEEFQAPDAPDIPLEMSTDDNGFGLDFESSDATPLAPIEESKPPSLTDADALDFDLGGLSLDLETSKPEPGPADATEIPDDPLETKLALAEEFNSIGDEDGARALIEEVIAESTGAMRAKAEQALAKLG